VNDFVGSKMRKTIGLIPFLKGTSDPKDGTPGCANFDHHYGGCLLSEKCDVEEGKRCTYFERTVLPVAWQIGCGEDLRNQYENQTKSVVQIHGGDIRRCGCGEVLKSRQRFCKKCSIKRRRETYRKNKAKTRISDSVNRDS
jgi:hypothetical protein